MSKFHQLKVANIRRETPDTVSISFEIPEGDKDLFVFKPGQYITIKTLIDSEDIRRSYSICASPEENELRVAVKKVDNGKFSTWANESLQTGDLLEVMPPMGHFCPELNSGNNKSYLLIAAGSGITPVISIAKSILRNEPDSEIILIYGNKGKSSIIFKEELDSLKNQYLHRLNLVHIFSREQLDSPILNGRINGEKLEQLAKTIIDTSNIDQVFICGPNEMIASTKDWLIQNGVPETKVMFELFGAPDATSKLSETPKKEIVQKFDGEYSQVTIILDGKETSFELSSQGDTILDASMKNGADVPYACKGAVCCTCRAQVTEGDVQMDLNYSLTDTEVANGFILTCQSHPITEKVVVNFDVS